METKELRIGNLLEYPMFGILPIRNGQDIDDVIENSGSPISISSEILLKVGFKSISDIHPTFRLGRIIIEENVMKDGYTFRIAINNQESLKIIKLKYLHELQNIVHANSGQELNTSGLINTKK